MTEEQLEIQRLKKANKELYEIVEDLSVDCYKCTCGVASECNCFHLGLKPDSLSNLKKRDEVNSLLENLEF